MVVLPAHAFVRTPTLLSDIDGLLQRSVSITAVDTAGRETNFFGYLSSSQHLVVPCSPLVNTEHIYTSASELVLNLVASNLVYDWCLLSLSSDAILPNDSGFVGASDELLVLSNLHSQEGTPSPILAPARVVNIDTTTAQALYVVETMVPLTETGVLLSATGDLIGVVSNIEVRDGHYVSVPLISMLEPVPRGNIDLARAATMRDYIKEIISYSHADNQVEIAATCHEWMNRWQDDPSARHCLASTDIKARKFGVAAGLLQPLIEANRSTWLIYRTAAELALEFDNVESAIQFFREALRRHPNDFKTAFALGTALMQEGDLAESRSLLTRALDIRPTSISAMSNLARALVAVEAYDEAEALILRGLELAPESLSLLYTQAEVYCSTDNISAAMGLWKQIRLLNRPLAERLYSECLAGELL